MSKKPSILIIEDNLTTQETLKKDLEPLGLDVLPVFSSEKAWDVLASGTRPDAIILDFHLPGEDGPSFFRRLHVDPRFKDIAVIPFTALVGKNDTPSFHKVANFINARETHESHIQKIVSKKGREDISQTPPELILSISHALSTRNVVVAPEMRDRVRQIMESIVKKMDDDYKHQSNQ